MPRREWQKSWKRTGSAIATTECPNMIDTLLVHRRQPVFRSKLAPFLLITILIVVADKKLMQSRPSSRLGWIVVAVTTMAMFVATSLCLLCSVPTNPRAEVWVPRSSDRGALQQIVQPTNSKPTVAVWFKQDAVLSLFLGIAMIFRQEVG